MKHEPTCIDPRNCVCRTHATPHCERFVASGGPRSDSSLPCMRSIDPDERCFTHHGHFSDEEPPGNTCMHECKRLDTRYGQPPPPPCAECAAKKWRKVGLTYWELGLNADHTEIYVAAPGYSEEHSDTDGKPFEFVLNFKAADFDHAVQIKNELFFAPLVDDWRLCADGLPPDGTFCAVQFDDGSIGAAIAHSDWEYKFFDRRKYVGRNGKRMREDFELAGRPIRYYVIPAPPVAP